MLLHRLPLDQSYLCSVPSAHTFYEVARIPRLSLQHWLAVALVLDLLAAACMPLLAYGAFAIPRLPLVSLAGGAAGSAAVWLLAAHGLGVYDPSRVLAGRSVLAPAGAACIVGLGSVVLLLVATGNGDALAALTASAASVTVWILLTRVAWQACLRAALGNGLCLERVLVMGGSVGAARATAATIERSSGGRVRAASCIPVPGSQGAPSVAWVEDAVNGKRVDRILIAGFEQAADACRSILAHLATLAVDVTLVSDEMTVMDTPLCTGRIGGFPAFEVAARPLDPVQVAAKRAADIVVSVMALLLLVPILLLVCLAIKLDSRGPVLFGQRRIGFQGIVFRVWKFRTMYCDMTDERAVRQTVRNDSRVTRVGRILRRTSIDELPQLLNVLRGEMSIVGPRPHATGMTVEGFGLHDLVEGYGARHRMKPGITGWAQVNGSRGELDTETKLRRRLALDYQYIENWSFTMDLWIMARTAALLLFDRHAY
jgi:polysaccharide biosynthesis protein PslA